LLNHLIVALAEQLLRSMRSSLTTEVVSFVLDGRRAPSEVRRVAVEHVIDGFAVMLAGSRTDCSKKLVDFLAEWGRDSSSSMFGFKVKSCPSDAALVNGTSGHADDYDDTQLSTSPDRVYGLLTHPTVPVLAAALAVGEKVGSPGEELLDAFIRGFEVECKLAEAIDPEHYKKGFHTTGTIGTFGACVSSSVLLGLGEDELRYALGIAASMSSGIRANFGTMTKPLHAGKAASNGVMASMLGKRGFTSDPNSLDGQWGFMTVFGGKSDPDKITGKLGNPYALVHPGATLKMYPCGSLAQPSMDALLEIVKEEELKSGDIRRIQLRAGPNILEPLRYKRPANELQAKFSLQFGLASIVIRRRAGLREYTTQFVNEPEVREMMERVETIYDPALGAMGVDKMRSIIEVELFDGRVIKRSAETARGTPEKPLKEADIYEKFSECAGFILDAEGFERVYSTIKNIEGLSDIRQLTSLVSK